MWGVSRLDGFQRAGLALLIGLLALTALGGIVRVTGSGLACPDWPGCYGSVIPTGDFGEFAAHQVWLEWTHRLAAAIIGLLILAYAVYAWRRRPRRVWLPAALAVPMLAVQVALGALTVTEQLEALIVTLHLAAAMIIVMLIAVSWLGAFDWPTASDDDAQQPLGGSAAAQARTFARIALLCAMLVYAVVVVGSYVTHVGSNPDLPAQVGPGGAACGNRWPLCIGGLWPDGGYAQWNMSHRLLVAVAALALLRSGHGRRNAAPAFARPDPAHPHRGDPVRGPNRVRSGDDLDQLRRLGAGPAPLARIHRLDLHGCGCDRRVVPCRVAARRSGQSGNERDQGERERRMTERPSQRPAHT